MIQIGNNGNRLAETMHQLDLLHNNITIEEVKEAARPYMAKESHLNNDDLWEDFIYAATEMGYIINL